MNVAELFYKLGVIADVEIVVAFLPEVVSPTQARKRLEWATYLVLGICVV